MIDLINDFYKECTVDGIISTSGTLGKFAQKVCIPVYLICTLVLCASFFVLVDNIIDLDTLLSNKTALNYVLFSGLLLLCLFLIVFTSLQIALRFYQYLSIKILKNKYYDLLGKKKIDYRKKKNFKEKFLYPFYFDNEFHKIIAFIKTENTLKYAKNKHIDKKHIHLIDELIDLNNMQLSLLNENLMRRSNRVIYAFVGGILINKFLDFLYYVTLHTDYKNIDFINVGISLLFLITFIVIICIICNKFYSWAYLNLWNSNKAKQIQKTEDFNNYLKDKKIEILQNE